MNARHYNEYFRAQAELDKRQRPELEGLYDEDRTTWHLIYGLRCGYPLCCVLWFCSMSCFWATGNYGDDFNKTMGKGHALCPNCMIRQFTQNCE